MMRNILHILNKSSFLFFFYIDYDGGAGYVFGKEKRSSTWKDNKLPGHPSTTQPILRLTNCIFGQSLELGKLFHRTWGQIFFKLWSQLIVGLPTYLWAKSKVNTNLEFIPEFYQTACCLSICSYFGCLWQMLNLRRAGLSMQSGHTGHHLILFL